MSIQGLITLESAITIVLGANIGTCVTALLAVIGKPREAVRAAIVHLIFNIAGVMLWVLFIPELASLARALSPSEIINIQDRVFDQSLPRQIANAHTLFNVLNTLIFIGFTQQIMRFVEWLIPDKPLDRSFATRLLHLDETLLSTPAFALDRARREVGRFGKNIIRMLDNAIPALLQGDRAALTKVANMQYFVKLLDEQIIEYLRKANQSECSKAVEIKIVQLMHVTDQFAYVGSIIESNIITIGYQNIEKRVHFSDPVKKRIRKQHRHIRKALVSATRVARSGDANSAAQIMKLQDAITKNANKITQQSLLNLFENHPEKLQRYRQGIEIIEHMTRIYGHCQQIAETLSIDP